MAAKVVSFDLAKRARLAAQDPGGHKCAAPIRHVLDSIPLNAQVAEWQRSLDQARYQWAAQSLQLGFHITSVMVLPFIFMAAYAATPNWSTPASQSGDLFRRDRLRPHE
jgi:hypothetical protein